MAARAQGTITIAAGSTTSTVVNPSGKLAVPIIVDMSAATPGTNLASLFTTVSWASSRLTLDSVKAGAFGTLTPNTTNASTGSATLSLQSPTGTTATVTIGTMYFTGAASNGGTQILLSPSAASNDTPASVLSLVRPRSLDVCVAQSGLLGDVTNDGRVNIIDAQQIARYSVGLSVTNPAAVAAQGDVNNDGRVNVIDAQQIARYSVGLSAPARINTPLFVPPTVASLTINQTSPTVAIGGNLQMSATPLDAGSAVLTGCAPVSWGSSNAAVATVNVTGYVVGISAGTATLTATAGAQTAQATVTVGTPPSMTIVSGDNQVQAANSAFFAPLTVLVKDATNTPVVGATVVFATTSGGGSITGGSPTLSVQTNASGLATATWIAGGVMGSQTATATLSGLVPVAFSGRSTSFSIGNGRCELTTAGAAYCWGYNAFGQVGDGTTTDRAVPTAVLGGLTFTSLADGNADHACGLTSGGAAYCWGFNGYGQLGDGTTTNRSGPVAVAGGLTFTQLAVSVNATCGRTSGGALYCWGSAGYGLYGDGVQGTVHLTPTAVVAGGTQFTSVALGQNHACAIATSGTAYCWGLGVNGEIGDGSTITRTAPTVVPDGRTYTSLTLGASHTCGLITGGAAYCWGNGVAVGSGSAGIFVNPTAVSGGLTFTSISAAISTNTCAVTGSGRAYCWGGNSTGQLGDGTTTTQLLPTPVQGGIVFASLRLRNGTSCGRTSGGQPYCWGDNSSGQVGDGTFTQRLTPVPVNWVEGTPGVAVSLVAQAGNNQTAGAGAPVSVPPSVLVRDYAGTPVSGVQVTFSVTSGGGSLTGGTAITNGGGIATLGSWTLGPTVGVSNSVTAAASGLPVATFVATSTVAPASIAVVVGDNQVQAQGRSFIAPLKVIVKDATNSPVVGAGVVFATSAGSINGGSPTLTVLTDGSGQASATWNASNSPGNQTATATVSGLPPVTFNGRSTSSTTGFGRCELTTASAAYCWGYNAFGQVGDGTTTDRAVPTAVLGGLAFTSLAEGSADHACGLTSGGAAYCWGFNGYGQLGDGSTTNRTAPVAVSGGLTFTQLAVSVNATCGRTSGGALYCWGSSGYGLYGDGVQGTVHLTPTAVAAGGTTFSSVALGQNHACAVATSGTAYCWGLGTFGELGDGSVATRSTPAAVPDGRTYLSLSVGDSHSCGVTNAGLGFCWGYGGAGGIGDGSASTLVPSPSAVAGGLTFTSISASGSSDTCGRTSTGQVYCWGDNSSGQVGDGTTTSRRVPTIVQGSIVYASVRIRNTTGCGRTAGGQPYCWGYNGFGQVGDGTTTQRPTPVAVTWVEGSAGSPVSLVVQAGNNQTAAAGTSVGVAPSVVVRDFTGAPVSGVTVTFTVTSGGGSVTGGSATTNTSGIATLGSWIVGSAAGSNSIAASAGSLPTVIFTATAF